MKLDKFKFVRYLLLPAILISVFWQCSGLVRLKLTDKDIGSSPELWLTAYKNNLRQNSIEVDVVPPYQIAWDKRYKSVITDNPLALGNYIIFTIKNGMLAFFDIGEGTIIGDGKIAPGFLHSGTISENILYYAANLGREPLGALDLETLKKKWKISIPPINTSPLVWNDKIFVGCDNGQIFCLNKYSGEKIWEVDGKSALFGVPAEKGGQLYFSDVKGNIYCLDGKTGKLIWERKLTENIYAGPMIGTNKIFIGSTSGNFYALSQRTGETLWMLSTSGSIYGNAAFKDGTVFFGNNAHHLFAVEAETGEVNWDFKTKGINNTAPLVGEDFIYFGSWDKSFYVLDRFSGQMIYRKEFKRPIKSSPIIYHDRIYFQTANDHFYCLENQSIATKTDQ